MSGGGRGWGLWSVLRYSTAKLMVKLHASSSANKLITKESKYFFPVTLIAGGTLYVQFNTFKIQDHFFFTSCEKFKILGYIHMYHNKQIHKHHTLHFINKFCRLVQQDIPCCVTGSEDIP